MKRLQLLTDLPYAGKMRAKGDVVEADDETARRWLRDGYAKEPADKPKAEK